MNGLDVLIYLMGSAIRTYPETSLVRILLQRMKLDKKSLRILTFVFVILINASVFPFLYSVERYTYWILSDVVTVSFWIYVEMLKDKNTRLIIFFRNTYIRSTWGVLLFIFIFFFAANLFGDPYYIIPLIAASIYTYLSLKRKRF